MQISVQIGLNWNWPTGTELGNKTKHTFIQFDVVNFYPSITEKLLKDSIKWARKFLKIEPEDERTILCAKKPYFLMRMNFG